MNLSDDDINRMIKGETPKGYKRNDNIIDNNTYINSLIEKEFRKLEILLSASYVKSTRAHSINDMISDFLVQILNSIIALRIIKHIVNTAANDSYAGGAGRMSQAKTKRDKKEFEREKTRRMNEGKLNVTQTKAATIMPTIKTRKNTSCRKQQQERNILTSIWLKLLIYLSILNPSSAAETNIELLPERTEVDLELRIEEEEMQEIGFPKSRDKASSKPTKQQVQFELPYVENTERYAANDFDTLYGPETSCPSGFVTKPVTKVQEKEKFVGLLPLLNGWKDAALVLLTGEPEQIEEPELVVPKDELVENIKELNDIFIQENHIIRGELAVIMAGIKKNNLLKNITVSDATSKFVNPATKLTEFRGVFKDKNIIAEKMKEILKPNPQEIYFDKKNNTISFKMTVPKDSTNVDLIVETLLKLSSDVLEQDNNESNKLEYLNLIENIRLFNEIKLLEIESESFCIEEFNTKIKRNGGTIKRNNLMTMLKELKANTERNIKLITQFNDNFGEEAYLKIQMKRTEKLEAAKKLNIQTKESARNLLIKLNDIELQTTIVEMKHSALSQAAVGLAAMEIVGDAFSGMGKGTQTYMNNIIDGATNISMKTLNNVGDLANKTVNIADNTLSGVTSSFGNAIAAPFEVFLNKFGLSGSLIILLTGVFIIDKLTPGTSIVTKFFGGVWYLITRSASGVINIFRRTPSGEVLQVGQLNPSAQLQRQIEEQRQEIELLQQQSRRAAPIIYNPFRSSVRPSMRNIPAELEETNFSDDDSEETKARKFAIAAMNRRKLKREGGGNKKYTRKNYRK
jgi:hypothetical protein